MQSLFAARARIGLDSDSLLGIPSPRAIACPCQIYDGGAGPAWAAVSVAVSIRRRPGPGPPAGGRRANATRAGRTRDSSEPGSSSSGELPVLIT